jgi:hypothetical protein
MTELTTVVGIANIGAFVVEAIGLGFILKDSHKHPSTIVIAARAELYAALNLLLAFYEYMDDDVLSPLVGRYEK